MHSNLVIRYIFCCCTRKIFPNPSFSYYFRCVSSFPSFIRECAIIISVYFFIYFLFFTMYLVYFSLYFVFLYLCTYFRNFLFVLLLMSYSIALSLSSKPMGFIPKITWKTAVNVFAYVCARISAFFSVLFPMHIYALFPCLLLTPYVLLVVFFCSASIPHLLLFSFCLRGF